MLIRNSGTFCRTLSGRSVLLHFGRKRLFLKVGLFNLHYREWMIFRMVSHPGLREEEIKYFL